MIEYLVFFSETFDCHLQEELILSKMLLANRTPACKGLVKATPPYRP